MPNYKNKGLLFIDPACIMKKHTLTLTVLLIGASPLFISSCFQEAIDDTIQVDSTEALLEPCLDSIIDDSNNLLLEKNLESGTYKLTNKETEESYENLAFARRIYQYFQILDSNNQVFYIGADWKKEEQVKDFMGVCGTVPRYSLTSRVNGSNFEILEDETSYDYNNEIPAEIQFTVTRKEADSVLFINGRSSFKFTSNFDVGVGITNPRMVLLYKKGKYFTRDNPDLKFDAIDFTNYHHSLKTIRGSLYGLLNIMDPKYKRIEKFNYYLAEAETKDGKIDMVDIEGNEYSPGANKE